MKKKIGLCLAYKGTNYGALLQAFATQYMVESLGYDTVLFDYAGARDVYRSPESLVYYALQRLNGKSKKPAAPKLDELHQKNLQERRAAADAFRGTYLHNIVRLKSKEALLAETKTCDAVLVGSDQLWAPTVAFTNFRSLRFVPEDIKKISYATSMGCSEYPWYVKRNAAQFLERIDHLSVREEQAKNIVENISKAKAKVVADPTYLLSAEQWKQLIPQEDVTEKGYVLCFLLGENPDMARHAKTYAQKHGLRTVCVMSNEVQADDSYADEVLSGRTPKEFLNLVRNADCVFTDSFHGFAFSVINEKQVYITYRVRKGTYSRNSRIDNIVAKFGMENRLIRDPANEELSPVPVDYTKVSPIVEAFRQESLKFLSDSLAAEK